MSGPSPCGGPPWDTSSVQFDEVLRDASPLLRRLLGFKVWSTYGGTDDHAAEFIERVPGQVGELAP